MIQWKRIENDGSFDVLTVVQIDGRSDYLIQITADVGPGADFVGLFDLEDGEQVQLPNPCEWEAPDDVPSEVIQTVEENWECGLARLERLP